MAPIEPRATPPFLALFQLLLDVEFIFILDEKFRFFVYLPIEGRVLPTRVAFKVPINMADGYQPLLRLHSEAACLQLGTLVYTGSDVASASIRTQEVTCPLPRGGASKPGSLEPKLRVGNLGYGGVFPSTKRLRLATIFFFSYIGYKRVGWIHML